MVGVVGSLVSVDRAVRQLPSQLLNMKPHRQMRTQMWSSTTHSGGTTV